ncbi:Stk1 family PASTA domain-containing Ser/Thr kinase [Clostridium sp.]|jgi:eukaryotic-like serine/threonine-protein kinase|uniref:Stk1 family PASTA domain-containing Ser/Thr kinase n=1 Tax=Clostridium sp. TaxID=1506 RepID=UPI003A5C1015
MIGTMLGNRYELLEKIGEGGMAEVYRSKDHLLNRNVAVKILKDQFSSDTEFVEKFKREATAAASLSNNNIVNIYDVGSQNNINYIVMEYVKGKTLKQVIREKGRIAPSQVVEMSIQIAKALECAHKNNIIHRDIKPHNILVTEDGIVKVTDFGIAKASNSVTITNSNKVMGSAHYFSPEQAKGSFVDFRTDIYSLGIVIYEMVTGKVPYDAESPVLVALKHIQEPVVPPKDINENIPDGLNRLILKAVEKEPIKRYQTMTDMLVDLKKVQNNEVPNIQDNDLEEDMTRIMNPVDVNNLDDKYKDEYYEPENIKIKRGLDPRKKRNILVAAIVIMTIVIGSILGYSYYNKEYGNLAETTVPYIIGMEKDKAKEAVEAKKLKFVVVSTKKSDKEEGTVLESSPEPGTSVKVNSEVRVVISGGPNKLTVPNVVDVDYDTARDIILQSGLKVGDVSYRYSDDVERNHVISQDPEFGSSVEEGSSVNIVVSSGPETKYISVPDVTGRNISDAESILSNAGVSYAEKSVITEDESQDGIVLSQSESGSKVKEGTTIIIKYYKYEKPNYNDDENSSEEIDENNTDSTDQDTDSNGSSDQDNGNNQNNETDSGNNSNSTNKGTGNSDKTK